MKPVLVLGVVIALVAGAALLRLGRGPDRAPEPGWSLESFLDLDAQGFDAVSGDFVPDFPSDHGAHPGSRSEAWNLFGQLRDAQGEWGFQLTLARLALTAHPPERASAWAASDLFRGQLSVLRAGLPEVRSAERLTRAALGLAGARARPPSVWVEDWSLTLADGPSEPARMDLFAQGGGAILDLELKAVKSPVSLVDLGLLVQDAGALGLQAYVLPRLAATGTLTLDGQARPVQGPVWLDHAWGPIPSARGQVSINRFAILLEGDRELLCLQLRREDGTGTPIPACALILPDGQVQRFRRREIRLEPLERWRSPRTGSSYPVVWRLAVPIINLELELSPLTDDQESDGPIRLWSGVVRAAGRLGEAAIGGRGRIETTADPARS